MKIRLKICTDDGWQTVDITVPAGAAEQCYALPKGADRMLFWEQQSGVSLPRGYTWMWEPI